MVDSCDPFTDEEDSPDEGEVINPVDIRFAAMNLLARREHTQLELLQKLTKRFPDKDKVTVEVERLGDENLQSDQRFAESFVRQRAGRGYGPVRIRQEMKQRGIGDMGISLAMEEAEVDWFEVAGDTYDKKFRNRPVADMKDKAKRIRFMQYRGFVREHYESLID